MFADSLVREIAVVLLLKLTLLAGLYFLFFHHPAADRVGSQAAEQFLLNGKGDIARSLTRNY